MKVAELWVYPVKGMKGVQLSQATIGLYGIEYDRQFMVVDTDTGMFVAQRQSGPLGIEIKSLCQVVANIEGQHLILSAPGMRPIGVRVDGRRGRRQVQIRK